MNTVFGERKARRSSLSQETGSPEEVSGVDVKIQSSPSPSTLPGAVCIIPKRLLCLIKKSSSYVHLQCASSAPKHYVFSTDREFTYDPFYADFGPLNLGQTWRYCEKINKLLNDPALKEQILVHKCSADPHKRANAVYLVTAYCVICLGQTPSEAFQPFQAKRLSFVPYRDATYGPCGYQLSILDCLEGIYHAMKLGWISYQSFDIASYEHYEKVLHGDLHWIVPQKFIAFSGPTSAPINEGETPHPATLAAAPESYVPIFKRLGVTLVIRLNKKQYCRKVFTKSGINHADLYFLDGSCPTRAIIYKFISMCENESGAIAVHCKAGLGRTGTLIGCYAMKNYNFAAAAWIGWNRVCRPGSVLGPQQHFLHSMQNEMATAKSIVYRPLPIAPARSAMVSAPWADDMTQMTPEELRVAQEGDMGQADRLLTAKRAVSSLETYSPNNGLLSIKMTDRSSSRNGINELMPNKSITPRSLRLTSQPIALSGINGDQTTVTTITTESPVVKTKQGNAAAAADTSNSQPAAKTSRPRLADFRPALLTMRRT